MLTLLRPAPPLGRFVEVLWHADLPAQPHARERLLPQGSLELVINLRREPMAVFDLAATERTFRQSVVCGPHSQHFAIDTATPTTVVGVHFRPGGCYPFFRPPAESVWNQHVGLDDVWDPAAASELRERLLAAPTPRAQLTRLGDLLLARLVRPLARHPAVAYALARFDAAPWRPVAEVTDALGLSPRRFIETFSREVGLTPKLYTRVQRFQRVLGQAHGAADVDWTDVALACGYYDQAHFIHDFKAFSGLTPSAWRAAHSPSQNHVAV